MDINDNNAANFPVGVPLGASGTTMQGLGQNGVLNTLGGSAEAGQQAMEFARQLYPEAPKADPWEAAFQFFAEMGKQASVPGSTAFGAAASSLQAPMDYLAAKKKEKRETDRARMTAAVQLAPNLKPAVSKGVTKVVSSKQLKVMFPDEEIAEGLYNLTEGQDGSIEISKVGGAGSTTNLYTGDGGSKEFLKILSKGASEEFNSQLKTSYASIDTLNTFKQLFSLLNREDFDTGVLEDAIRPLQSIAKSFGLESLIDTEDLASKELFVAKANELVLASVAKMKGALSDRELGFLAEQNVNLRSTTKGNKFLLLLQMQQIEKSIKFAPFANAWGDLNATDTDGQISTPKQYRNMIRDWKASPVMSENPYQFISRLSDGRERELVIGAGGGYDDDGRIVGLSEDQRIQIGRALEEEFNLYYVENTFNNFLWD